MRFHKLQNVQIALDYLKHRQVSIRGEEPGGGGVKRQWGPLVTVRVCAYLHR